MTGKFCLVRHALIISQNIRFDEQDRTLIWSLKSGSNFRWIWKQKCIFDRLDLLFDARHRSSGLMDRVWRQRSCPWERLNGSLCVHRVGFTVAFSPAMGCDVGRVVKRCRRSESDGVGAASRDVHVSGLDNVSFALPVSCAAECTLQRKTQEFSALQNSAWFIFMNSSVTQNMMLI